MAETIVVQSNVKAEKYKELFVQLQALVSGESDVVANAANITAALKQVFNFLWVGFYFVKENELVLGPFQGPVACTRIAYGKGVCGTAWKNKQTILVPDVNLFPGHIACSSLSKSEIVVPVFVKNSNEIKMVLDVDSEVENFFDEEDKIGLETICTLLC